MVHTRFLFRPPCRVLPNAIKKSLQRGRGGEGTNTPQPLGYVSFGFSREMERTTLQEKEGKDGR